MQDIFELHILPMDVALEMMHTNGYGVWVMDAGILWVKIMCFDSGMGDDGWNGRMGLDVGVRPIRMKISLVWFPNKVSIVRKGW